jgi:hypothetical protein
VYLHTDFSFPDLSEEQIDTPDTHQWKKKTPFHDSDGLICEEDVSEDRNDDIVVTLPEDQKDDPIDSLPVSTSAGETASSESEPEFPADHRTTTFDTGDLQLQKSYDLLEHLKEEKAVKRSWDDYLEQNSSFREIAGVKNLKKELLISIANNLIEYDFDIDEFLFKVSSDFIQTNDSDAARVNSLINRFRTYQLVIIPDINEKLSFVEAEMHTMKNKEETLILKHTKKAEKAEIKKKLRKCIKAGMQTRAALRADAINASYVLETVSPWMRKDSLSLLIKEYAELRNHIPLPIQHFEMNQILRDAQSQKMRYVAAAEFIKQYLD